MVGDELLVRLDAFLRVLLLAGVVERREVRRHLFLDGVRLGVGGLLAGWRVLRAHGCNQDRENRYRQYRDGGLPCHSVLLTPQS